MKPDLLRVVVFGAGKVQKIWVLPIKVENGLPYIYIYTYIYIYGEFPKLGYLIGGPYKTDVYSTCGSKSGCSPN